MVLNSLDILGMKVMVIFFWKELIIVGVFVDSEENIDFLVYNINLRLCD